MRLCTICISCTGCTGLPKRARFLSEPPPNRLQISPFPCSSAISKQPEQRALGDPEFCQSGQNHQQNFRKSLSRKYPNSFSQNTKDHLHFSWVGLNENLKFRRTGDTSCLCDRAPTSAV